MLKISAVLAALSFFTVVTNAQPQVSLVTRPLSFEPNQGQDTSKAQFIAHGPGYLVQLTQNQVAFKLSPTQTVKFDLLNSKKGSRLIGDKLLPGKANYFPNSDQTQWHSNIPTYERVSEHDIYPGIDVAYYGNQNRLEYDFVIKPHADAAQILLKLAGSDQARIDVKGNLLLRVGSRDVRVERPIVYQTAKESNAREPIQANYRLEAGLLTFSLGTYDHSRPLVIDPVLQYSQYLPTAADAFSIDLAGNAYLVTTNYPQNSVTKLSPSGTTLYTTNFGTALAPSSIAVDKSGKAYITGGEGYEAALPTGPNSYASLPPQARGMFFAQISADGSSIPYATYLAGNTVGSNYSANAIAVDTLGAAYLTGTTNATDFPTTAGAYQTTNPASLPAGFIVKFNPALSGQASLVYSTLLRPLAPIYIGSTSTVLNAIAVDLSGDAYVTGSGAPGFPITSGAFQYAGYQSNLGGVFVTRLSANGSHLIYSAYLGYGVGYGIAVDKQANAYITGTVGYAGFPTTPGAYQTTYAGAFVTKLDPSGSTEIYSTFLGGPQSISSGTLIPTGIALTPDCPAKSPETIVCDAYIVGTTTATDLPLTNAIQNTPAPLPAVSAFLVELADSGQSALLSTYLSGATNGIINATNQPALAIDSSGNIDVIGRLGSAYPNAVSDFPFTLPTGDLSYGSSGFFAKISPIVGSELIAFPASAAINSPLGLSSSAFSGSAKVRVSNFGSSPVNISQIQISPSNFWEVNDCGAQVPAGGSCTLTINFTPAIAGSVTGSLAILSNATNGSLTIPLTGYGQSEDLLQISSRNLAFPLQTVGTTSATQSLVLTNIGNAPASPVIGPLYSTEFSITNNCPAQLTTNSSCNLTVTFTPQQAGLRVEDFIINDSPTSFSGIGVQLSGTGILPGVTQSAVVTPSAVTFGPRVIGYSTPASQTVTITNFGIRPIVVTSITAAGDFQVQGNYCSSGDQLNPTDTCSFSLLFNPTAAGTRTGILAITDSTSATAQMIPLTGTGLTSSENVEIYPSTSVVAPDQPINNTGPDQPIIFENTGTAPITIYRVLATGDFKIGFDSCSANTVSGTSDDGNGSYSTCQISVDFAPAAIGPRTGTLTFYDSAPGSSHVVSLSGNGIAATGMLSLTTNSLTFPPKAIGSASFAFGANQSINLYAAGDSPVQVTSASVTGDFSLEFSYCGDIGSNSQPPFTINTSFLGYPCAAVVSFNPTAEGARTGTLTLHSSAGNQTVALSGTGISSVQAVQLIPGSYMDFGSLLVSQSGSYQTVYAYVSGTGPVTFSGASISGPNAQDFNLSSSCSGTVQANQACGFSIQFKPSALGARSATLTVVDSAGGRKQFLSLTGTGVAGLPAVTLSAYTATFPSQVQGTSSFNSGFVALYNNTTFSIPLGNVVIPAGFISVHSADNCSGQVIAPGKSCGVDIEFAPPATSAPANVLIAGYVAFTFANGNTLIRLPVSGYSAAPNYAAQLSNTTVNFPDPQAVGTTSTYQAELSIENNGSLQISVGAPKGTNVGAAGSNAEFSILTGNSTDSCLVTSLPAGSECSFPIVFTPNASGPASGTLNFPITYSNNTTAILTVKLNGIGVAPQRGAYLSPSAVTFPDQGVGGASPPAVITLTNSGNVSFIPGTPTATGDFAATHIRCDTQPLTPAATCQISATFNPSATGTRSGSLTVPITYFDGTTASLHITLTGTAISATRQLQILPLSVEFPPSIPNVTSSVPQWLTVTNIGNSPVTFGQDTISSNSVEFPISSDNCANTSLAANASCNVYLNFRPAIGSTGTRTGALTIADNSAGGPHTVPLSGISVPASQEVALSQTAVNFGTQAAGTTSPAQVIYLTNQASVSVAVVTISSVVLGGINPSDFTLNNNCRGSLYSYCAMTVTFAPQPGASGTRTATITETDSALGSPRTITLTGTAQ